MGVVSMCFFVEKLKRGDAGSNIRQAKDGGWRTVCLTWTWATFLAPLPPHGGRMRHRGCTVEAHVLGRLSEVGTKETRPMKTSAPICTMLILAGLCLGSAVTAMAQSVHGGGII